MNWGELENFGAFPQLSAHEKFRLCCRLEEPMLVKNPIQRARRLLPWPIFFTRRLKIDMTLNGNIQLNLSCGTFFIRPRTCYRNMYHRKDRSLPQISELGKKIASSPPPVTRFDIPGVFGRCHLQYRALFSCFSFRNCVRGSAFN